MYLWYMFYTHGMHNIPTPVMQRYCVVLYDKDLGIIHILVVECNAKLKWIYFGIICLALMLTYMSIDALLNKLSRRGPQST